MLFEKIEEHEIWCSRTKCCNTSLGIGKTIATHLKVYEIVQNYTFWFHHGERLVRPLSEYGDQVEEYESEDQVEELLRFVS